MIRTVIFAALGVLLTGYLLYQIGVGNLIRGLGNAMFAGSDQMVLLLEKRRRSKVSAGVAEKVDKCRA